MVDYIRRVLDATLDTYQPLLAAVELYGAKGVGKTMTASQRAASVLRLDMAVDVQRLNADPKIITELPAPLLIDEWSRAPQSWDLVRRAVDDGAPDGRFLLTASATVPDDIPVHSGAGRIVGFQMRPMSLAERGLTKPSVSLTDLLKGSTKISGQTEMRMAGYVHEIVSSGLPGIRFKPVEVRALMLDAYLKNLVQREFTDHDRRVRKPQTLMAWLAAYSAATANVTSYTRILDASTPGESDKPAKETTMAYRDALASLWMLDPLPAWLSTNSPLDKLGQAPKHYLADPALTCRLLHVNEHGLLSGDQGTGTKLRQGPLLGALFEHLASLSVRVYAQASQATVFHMRTFRGEHEIDMIVQSEQGAVLPIEVKLSQTVEEEDIRHITWLREKLGSHCLDGVILTTGEHAYRRQDGIAVVPLALLGP
ncbi:MAG: DUF4143 domain-containing protein [Propionibacteriaceae bacterium]|jgi:predicted AAA+ superfamily ATPase|nr:DUF4143 domain-containing protein [Propionibacteriaceae bacterium]